ncbi:MAG: signal peptidase I [Christensenellales bacterium]
MKNENNKESNIADSRIELKKEYVKRERRSLFLLLIAAAAVALCLRFFVFELVRVDGRSMEQTLHNNEYVFMERVTYWFREPDFGDIIICTYPDEPGKTFVKRIIGTVNDEILIRGGVLYINGEPDYTHFKEPMFGQYGPFIVPKDCFFVMGDNRNNSSDSRVVGPIAKERVLGKAIFVVWPLSQIRGLS